MSGPIYDGYTEPEERTLRRAAHHLANEMRADFVPQLEIVAEQNSIAIDAILERLSLLDRANPCTEEMHEEAGELTRWLATNAPTAFEKWEREHDQRVEAEYVRTCGHPF